MGFYYNVDQIAAMTNLSPRLIASGVNLGDELDAIRRALSEGNLGIAAKAYDVDALCKDGGAFSYKADTTSGLTLGYYGGRLIDGQSVVTIASGTIALPASQANVYVEVIYTGGSWQVSQNNTAFTAGGVPLFLCSTSGSAITTITNMRTLLEGGRDGAIVGKMLSTAQKTIPIYRDLGTIATAAGTTSRRIPMPSWAGKVARVSLLNDSALAQSDVNYAALGVVNEGTSGAGSTVVVDSAAANNSTKTTGSGGSAIAAKVDRAYNLSGTPANLNTAANDTLRIDIVVTGTLANTLPNAVAKIELSSDL